MPTLASSREHACWSWCNVAQGRRRNPLLCLTRVVYTIAPRRVLPRERADHIASCCKVGTESHKRGAVASHAKCKFGANSTTMHYIQPGSNWRPSACGADVIATRPWMLILKSVMGAGEQPRQARVLLSWAEPRNTGKACMQHDIHPARIELATFSVLG